MGQIKNRIEGYKENYGLNETNTPLILIAEILASIAIRLEEIANAMYR